MRKLAFTSTLALTLALLASVAQAAPVGATPVDALRAKFAALGDALRNNQYKRPLYIESSESSTLLVGDVYAVVAHPFPSVSTALTGDATRAVRCHFPL